ncbi:HAD family hydrolase [Dinoroseobacter sp. S375]|uniref:HAD family hydrolase n=1 Tax=Dinoroseobacter sp. S375 TaxID=3415136 RepID=UPI003C7D7555
MIQALLFDLDGTLLASDPLHARAFMDQFAAHGREIDEAFYNTRIHGRLNAEIFAEFFPSADGAAMAEEKEAAFRDLLGHDAPPMPGLLALLDRADRAGWAKAVVTNAPRVNAEFMLSSIGVAARFDTLVVSDECSAGKPDPAPYLEGLRRVGAQPDTALAFEDSPSGIRAAVAAGIPTLGLRSTLDDATLRAAGATATLADFTDPALGPLLDRQSGAAA